MDKSFMHHSLQMLHCPQCGSLYTSSEVGVLQETEMAILATITCAKCQHQSVVTISLGGVTTGESTDLKPAEVNKFIDSEPIDSDDLLDIHQYLKKSKGNFSAEFKDFHRTPTSQKSRRRN